MPKTGIEQLLGRCHHQQRHPWSCVAACVCIVRAWQGRDIDEPSLVAAWNRGPGPFSLEIDAAGECGKYLGLDPDTRPNREYLYHLLRERWLIVTVVPRPCELPHAIVLIQAQESRREFLHLDPEYSFEKQRFTLPDDEFFPIWTGEVVIPRDGPAR